MYLKRIYSRCTLREIKSLSSGFNHLRNYSVVDDTVHSRVADFQVSESLLGDYIWKNLDKWPNKTALVCADTDRSYTYEDVYRKSKNLAVFLRKSLKLTTSDTVAIFLPNMPEYAITIFASLHAGIKFTTINPVYTRDEVKRQLLDSNAKVIFTLTDLYGTVKEATDSMRRDIPIVIVKDKPHAVLPSGIIKFEEIIETSGDFPFESGTNDDVVCLPYSSGTTGLPKGVQLTHRNLVSNLQQIACDEFRLNHKTEDANMCLHNNLVCLTPFDRKIYHLEEVRYLWWSSKNFRPNGVRHTKLLTKYIGDEQDVVPLILPMYHIYGLSVILMNMFSQGCKLVTVPRFGTQIFHKLISNYKPNILYAVPPVMLMMLNRKDIQIEHLKCIRTVVSSAAPLGVADIEKFFVKTQGLVRFMQIYGMTECSPIILYQSTVLQRGIKVGASGLLVPNTKAKIVDVGDPDNTALGQFESGELLIKGPQVMKGYHNNEEATKNTIVDDGWIRTGDIAHYDEDGQFYITDRLKELIKVKGFQVAPAELEELLRTHPAVADAAVIGVPHDNFGEAPKAFVSLKPGNRANVHQIRSFISGQVAPYKDLVGGVVILDKIPKTASGKTLRRDLRNL